MHTQAALIAPNPEDTVSLSALAKQMMAMRDDSSASVAATVGEVRDDEGNVVARILDGGGAIVNKKEAYEMLGGNWVDAEARRAELNEMRRQYRELPPEEKLAQPVPFWMGPNPKDAIAEFVYGPEYVGFVHALQAANTTEKAVALFGALAPTGYSIEAVFERPQMPAEDAEMLAAKAAADAWRNSLRKDGERRSDAV